MLSSQRAVSSILLWGRGGTLSVKGGGFAGAAGAAGAGQPLNNSAGEGAAQRSPHRAQPPGGHLQQVPLSPSPVFATLKPCTCS